MSDGLSPEPLVVVEEPPVQAPKPGLIDHKLSLAVQRDAMDTAKAALELADRLAGYDSDEWELEIAALKSNARLLSTKYLYSG